MPYYSDDESFDALVAKDVRNKTSQEERFYLRDPENLDDWYDSLVALNRSIDFQFASNKIQKATKTQELHDNFWALQEYLDSYNDWKLKTLRFKHEVESRIAECKKLRKKYFTDNRIMDSSVYKDIQLILQAIDEHRSTILGERTNLIEGGKSRDDQIEELESLADEKLWSVLNDKAIERIKDIFSRQHISEN